MTSGATHRQRRRRPSRILALTAGLLLGGCHIATPYEAFSDSPLADDATVVVSITHAMLGDDAGMRKRFWAHVEQVEDALADQPGLIGFSKRAALGGDDAWTMTVWRDEASLRAFVRSDTHQAAIRNAMPGLHGARFARFEIDQQQVPLSWDVALDFLETHARGYGHAR